MVAIVIDMTAKRVTRLVLESVFSFFFFAVVAITQLDVLPTGKWSGGVISVNDHSRDLVRYNVDTNSRLRESP